MKQKFALLALLPLLLFARPAHAEFRDVKGIDWMQLYPDQRMDRLKDSMHFLRRHKVRLEDNAEKYYDEVYKRLRANPSLYDTDVTAILADYVHDTEPKNQEAVEALGLSKKGA